MTNRSPQVLSAVSLRRVKPRSARLMAPISSVSTNEGDFQVWSDPSNDKRSTSIPLDIALDSRLGNDEARLIVWIFLPEKAAAAELVLELTLSDEEEKLRRYRLVAGARLKLIPKCRLFGRSFVKLFMIARQPMSRRQKPPGQSILSTAA